MQDVPSDCDAVAIATEWPEFGKLNWAAARQKMIAPILFDGRNLLDRTEMESIGFLYKGVGR
jgi:UDPglucose 6-dehydrogenase